MLHRTRRVLPAAVAAALVGGLAACSTDEPEQAVPPAASASETASPSPSPTDAASKREQEAIDAAKATLTDYIATENRVAKNGYKDWQKEVAPYWGSMEYSNQELQTYEQRVQDHQRQEGEVVVVSMDALDYTPDAGGKGADEVVIDLCGDISGVTVYRGDEVAQPAASVPDRFVTKFVLQFHPDAEVWGIQSSETGVEPRAC